MFYEGCTIDEIRAFRELEGATFNFGEGDMKIEGWYGSEDAYYEMCLPEECGYDAKIQKYHYKAYKPKPKKKKQRLHQYYRKQIDKKKLKKLDEVNWYSVGDEGTHKKRYYYSNRRKVAKKISNKKVRRYRDIGNHGNYRKVYDFWWNVF